MCVSNKTLRFGQFSTIKLNMREELNYNCLNEITKDWTKNYLSKSICIFNMVLADLESEILYNKNNSENTKTNKDMVRYTIHMAE